MVQFLGRSVLARKPRVEQGDSKPRVEQGDSKPRVEQGDSKPRGDTRCVCDQLHAAIHCVQ